MINYDYNIIQICVSRLLRSNPSFAINAFFLYGVRKSMIVEVALYIAKYTQRIILCVIDTSMCSLSAIKLCCVCYAYVVAMEISLSTTH